MSFANVANVHGVRVAWETRGLSYDPAARAFAAFGGDAGPADVVLRVEAGEPRDDSSGFRPAFFQGNVRGFERDGEILIVAPAARVTIAKDGARIDAVVDAASLNDRGFADTTLVVALALALRHKGLFHLHAGALVRGDGTRVLVLGDSGSGKSTVTLALIDADARHLGDDTVFVAERDGRPCLLAFPRSFHLGPATARAFPALRSEERPGEPKRHVPIDALPGRPVERMDAPDLVLFPQVTREPATRAVPVSKADAFGLALRSCALVAVDGTSHKARELALLRDLLAGARAFELHLGADWLEAPAKTAERVLRRSVG